MNRADLASKLRQRQRDLGQVPHHLIDVLPDDAMIECYVTCSCCGERMVNDQALEQLIQDATDEQHFVDLLGEYTRRVKRAKEIAEESKHLWEGFPSQRAAKPQRRRRRA